MTLRWAIINGTGNKLKANNRVSSGGQTGNFKRIVEILITKANYNCRHFYLSVFIHVTCAVIRKKRFFKNLKM